MSIATRTLGVGKAALSVPALGLGTMGLSWGYNTAGTTDASSVIAAGLEASNPLLLCTAWIYTKPGLPHNEEVIGEAIKKYGRDKFIIVDKIGQDFAAKPHYVQTPEQLRTQLNESLARLGTSYLDVLVLNRPDPSKPIEDAIRAFKTFVEEGKVKYIGLSEASAEEIRRAHAVHPLTLVEQEWSLATRDIETLLVPTLQELGIDVLAYSPLSRGLLSGTVKSRADLTEGDWRLLSPRFSEDVMGANVQAADRLAAIAQAKGCTPSQLSLAWLLAKSPSVVPIPGSSKPERVTENYGAQAVAAKLTTEDIKAIEEAVGSIQGDRYGGMYATFNTKMQA